MPLARHTWQLIASGQIADVWVCARMPMSSSYVAIILTPLSSPHTYMHLQGLSILFTIMHIRALTGFQMWRMWFLVRPQFFPLMHSVPSWSSVFLPTWSSQQLHWLPRSPDDFFFARAYRFSYSLSWEFLFSALLVWQWQNHCFTCSTARIQLCYLLLRFVLHFATLCCLDLLSLLPLYPVSHLQKWGAHSAPNLKLPFHSCNSSPQTPLSWRCHQFQPKLAISAAMKLSYMPARPHPAVSPYHPSRPSPLLPTG